MGTTMEETIVGEISSARKALLDNCANLEQVANYCEDNYVETKDKRRALEETKNFTTQSLASVAYQINTLATSMLQLLDCTASQVENMDCSLNSIGLSIDLNDERIGRQTFKSSLLTPKDYKRSNKIIRSDRLIPVNSTYVSFPVDYSSLDDVGHGIKLGLPSASPRVSRAGSVSSLSSMTNRESPHGSVRQKASTRQRSSLAPVVSPTSPTSHQAVASPDRPSHLTIPGSQAPSETTMIHEPPIPPPPPLTTPPPIRPSGDNLTMAPGPVVDLSGVEEAVMLSPPPPPTPTDYNAEVPDEDLPPPPRPTSLLLPPSPTPQRQEPSPSPSTNGDGNLLQVPGDANAQQLWPAASPERPRKATVSRKASRSPRPVKRPPPPPLAAGHTTMSAVSNPLYGKAPPPPISAAPAPVTGPPFAAPPPPIPIGGGPGPPPPPPPPPIGGTGAKPTNNDSKNTNHHEKSTKTSQSKPASQSTTGFAEQLQQRLAKLQTQNTAGESAESSGKAEESTNNRKASSLAPFTSELSVSEPASTDTTVMTSSAEFITPETPDWAPQEYISKVVAIYDYTALRDDEMTFREGDVIYLTHDYRDDWFFGVLNGVSAMVPGNYVEQMP